MKAKFNVLIAVILLISSYQHNNSTGSITNTKAQKGMIKISVLYPAGDGKTFNWDYYLNKHVPLVKSALGDSVKLITIDKGISGREPGTPATYVAMFHMYFERLSAYQTAFAPHAQKVVADIPNYTNIQPVIQVSEVQQ